MILYVTIYIGGELMEKQYTVKEVAEILSMAEITIRQWIQHGKIKSNKIGNSRRIPESELKRILEE